MTPRPGESVFSWLARLARGRTTGRRGLIVVLGGLVLVGWLVIRLVGPLAASRGVVGRVVHHGQPVAGAIVRVDGHDKARDRTGADGGFVLPDAPVGEATVLIEQAGRRVGYPLVLEAGRRIDLGELELLDWR